MTTEQEAKKERNGGIGFGVVMALIIMCLGICSYILWDMLLIQSILIFLCAFVFLKIAYDAYTTPLLYVRQRISLINTYKEQEADLRKTHRISKYSLWR
jgi:hypothetical protein